MPTSPRPSDRRRAPRAQLLAAALPVLACVAALLGATARAGARCNDEVCLELLLPPHVKQVSSRATLELLVVLPDSAAAPVNVKVVLRREGAEPPRCFARYATIARGSSWTRVMFRLREEKSPVPPGEYAAGVARVERAESEKDDPCAQGKEAPRFLARRISVKP